MKRLGTRQYARIVDSWVTEIGLNPSEYGTHTMRRTNASLIYRRTKNLRAVQLLLGHTKLESTVRDLGIEVDDTLEMAEQTEIWLASGVQHPKVVSSLGFRKWVVVVVGSRWRLCKNKTFSSACQLVACGGGAFPDFWIFECLRGVRCYLGAVMSSQMLGKWRTKGLTPPRFSSL